MKITKTEFQYDFKKLRKELSKFTKDTYNLNKLISFLESKIQYGAFSSDYVFENSNYDFAITKGFIKELKEPIFSKKILKFFEDVDRLAITVNEDYETYEKINENVENLKLKENVEVQLYPTFCIFKDYYQKIEELFNFKDPWVFLEIIEDFNKNYMGKNLKHDTYQFGGNMCFTTQQEYNNFIGSYFGDYGDVGSVYISLTSKNDLYSVVDMF